MPGETTDKWPGNGFAAVFAGIVLAASIAVMAFTLVLARLDDRATGKMLVLFPPGLTDDQRFMAIVASGGRPIRPVWPGLAWVATADEPGFVGRLKANGAIAGYGDLPITPTLAGCAALSTGKPIRLFTVRP